MSTPADGAKAILHTALIDTGGWALNIGRLVDKPDLQVVIYETGGKPSNPAWAINFPSIQVRVRGQANGYAVARQKIEDVKNALLGFPSQDILGDRWTAVNAIGDIVGMGFDENNRPSFAMNFALIIEPADTGYRG